MEKWGLDWRNCPNFLLSRNLRKMGLRKWHLPVVLLGLISLHGRAFVEAQTQNPYSCGDNGNYTANSVYQTNLNSLFSSLPSIIGNSGFSNASIGAAPNRVSATAVCRADVQLAACRGCIVNATAEILQSCPLSREAVLWSEFCTIRFSNESFLGTEADRPGMMLYNTANVTSLQEFNAALRRLLDDLRARAAAGGPLIKIAAGNRTGPDFYNIYSLLQCSPDISADDCLRCLESAAQLLPQCCNGRPGARILLPSCTLRFETYPFFNLTRIQEVQTLLSPPLPPPPSLPPSASPPPQPSPGISTTTIIVIAVAASAAIILLLACFFICLRRKRKKPQCRETGDDDISTAESLQYEFEKIRAATNDFSEENKLGNGGFGAVYKGTLENGQQVAVKRLSPGSQQGEMEFKNEVLLVARLQHRNLVRLFGFTIRGTERILIYEFVENLSLDSFIFDPIKRREIDWDRRYKIIGGIARGLVYLHEDSRLRIIHRDLKPSNVLLDAEMNAKIADFGHARLFGMDESEGNTSRIVGTYGYMAPEYAFRGQFSVKVDVFSFGVVLLEIICGQKNSGFVIDGRAEDMLSFAWRAWREGTVERMIDPVLRATAGSLRDVVRCIHIGLLCVQDSAADRPAMASVVLMLNSASITLPLPLRPAFFVSNTTDSSSVGYSKTSGSDGEETPVLDPTVNEVSVSDFIPGE